MDDQTQTRDRDETHYADAPMPLRDYAGLTAAFNVAMVGGLALAERSGRRIPDRVSLGDILLVGVATQRLSRVITRSTLRAWLPTSSAGRAERTRIDRRGPAVEETAGHPVPSRRKPRICGASRGAPERT